MIRRFSFRGLSIQQRLPLLICILLLCIIIAFSLASYLSVKEAALKMGRERLRSLTGQLSSMFGQSMQALVAATKVMANNESIRQCLQSGGTELRSEALEILQKIRQERQDTTSVLVELLDSDRRRVLLSAKDGIESRVNFDSLLSLSFSEANSGIGKIYAVKDSMFYPVIVAITEQKKVIGYIARWRLLQTTPKAIETFSQLLGTNATLKVGNADGSLWTDLVKPVANPPIDTRYLGDFFEYSRPQGQGKGVIAAAQPVANTPWLILVEFSQQTVLETANRFLRWIIIIGIVLIAAGIFVAWLMSRNITRPLNKLTAAASAIAGGDYSATVEVDNRNDELGKLGRAFNTMAVHVRNAQENLEQKVVLTEQMNEQLRNLSAHLQNIREEERIHIAREMHDELGQLLTGFKMDVSWLNKKLMINNTDPLIREKLQEMSNILDEAVKFVRNLAAELRPSILDDLGLIPALVWHGEEFQKRFSITVQFNSQADELNVSSVIATGLFRMYQESLTNVARHADAKKVISTLEISEEEICLSISDDGKGFDMHTASERRTLGLLGMKERAAMIGGKLEIKSAPGQGTTVSISIPVRLPVQLTN
jgi:signal transduction histidine kinase